VRVCCAVAAGKANISCFRAIMVQDELLTLPVQLMMMSVCHGATVVCHLLVSVAQRGTLNLAADYLIDCV
jgi:hypothetical protein